MNRREVYVIEYRLCRAAGEVYSGIAHIASSEGRAVQWMIQNQDYGGAESCWWWHVAPEIVDNLNLMGTVGRSYSKDGRPLEYPPDAPDSRRRTGETSSHIDIPRGSQEPIETEQYLTETR